MYNTSYLYGCEFNNFENHRMLQKYLSMEPLIGKVRIFVSQQKVFNSSNYIKRLCIPALHSAFCIYVYLVSFFIRL